jgi:hypothetical protein
MYGRRARQVCLEVQVQKTTSILSVIVDHHTTNHLSLSNPKVNNSFGDIGPSCSKPPPTNPTSRQGAQKSARSKEGAWQNSCAV